MRFWGALWELVHTWQGLILAVLAVLGAIYYGPRKVLETWDWYLDRFIDSKVKGFLDGSIGTPLLTQHGPVSYAVSRSVQEIAQATQMSEKRVIKSLGRLSKKRTVVIDGDKWRVPHRTGH